MSYTLYTGTFEPTENTFLRLTANPYRIITSVKKDGVDITPVSGTTIDATSTDCMNYNEGILSGSYNLGKLTSATSTVNLVTTPFMYQITYHNYAGPTSALTSSQDAYYETEFYLANTNNVNGYKFNGWAVGSQNSNVIIPVGTTKGVLTEINSIGTNPASLQIPTLYPTSSTILHLYALWRPCAAVAINVTVTDGSPLKTTITVGN